MNIINASTYVLCNSLRRIDGIEREPSNVIISVTNSGYTIKFFTGNGKEYIVGERPLQSPRITWKLEGRYDITAKSVYPRNLARRWLFKTITSKADKRLSALARSASRNFTDKTSIWVA